MLRNRVAVFLATLILANPAPADPNYREISARSYEQAEKAMVIGDLQTAKVGYSTALANARLAGDMPPGAEAGLAQKLARVLGNVCERDEAEKVFLEAISAAEKASSVQSPRTFPLRIELAQFTFDTDQFQKAAKYFESAFVVGEGILTDKQPVAMAELIDTYSSALERSGRSSESQAARAKAAALREKGGVSTVVKGRDEYVPYPRVCN
jgi:hypothetical protein